MGVVLDAKRNSFPVLGEECLLVSREGKQWPQPLLPAAHDVENALADSVRPRARRKGEIVPKFRGQPVVLIAEGKFVYSFCHGLSPF